MHEVPVPFLREIVIFLVIAAVLVPLFHRVRVSPVLGFLIAGVALGPNGVVALAGEEGADWLRLFVIADTKSVHVLAEFGVVFLLFLIGLELSLERLWSMRRLVLGLGGTQVVVTGAVIGAIAFAWGNPAPAAILIGASFALSSTAVAMSELIARDEFTSRAGRASFAVLLFQDLSIVPLLILVAAFGSASEGSFAQSLAIGLGVAVAAAVAIYVVGRMILPPLFRLAAGTRSAEFFVAITLLSVIGASVATASAGLSLALGAFLAGVLLSETEFRHQIEVDMQPFKGLLMGVFFMSVGLGTDLSAVGGNLVWVLASVVGLIAVKSFVIAGLARLFGLPLPVALHVGVLLSEGGEFALLIVGMAMTLGVVDPVIGQFMLIVTGLSMMATPGLAAAGSRLSGWLERRMPSASLVPDRQEIAEFGSHVVIAGYGRAGAAIAELLREEQIPYVALDLDATRVAAFRARGEPVFFGDGRRIDVLARVGAERASAIVVTLDQTHEAERTVRAIRERWPRMAVYARSRDLAHARRLQAAGATRTIPEIAESSLQMGAFVLAGLGVPSEAVNTVVERVRARGYEGLAQE